MIYKPHFLYRIKLILVFLLARIKLFHPILPKTIRDELPTGWNDRMLWVAFKSGGKKLYFNYCSDFLEPNSYTPKAVVNKKYELTEEQVSLFYKNGHIGPWDLISSDEAERIRNHVMALDKTESKILSYARGDFQFENEESKLFAARLNAYDRHLEDSTLLNLFKHPAITERCAQLLGPDLILWRSNIFHVPPDSLGTAWHQGNTLDSQILVCSSALGRDISPTWHHKMARKYGVKFQQFMTLLVGIFVVILTLSTSSTVFTLVFFASGSLAGSIGPAMFITLIDRRTHYLALSSMMLVGLCTGLGWRLLGFNTLLNEAVPAFVVALITHEVLMKSRFKQKSGDVGS